MTKGATQIIHFQLLEVIFKKQNKIGSLPFSRKLSFDVRLSKRFLKQKRISWKKNEMLF